jgi:hypothetical protein
MTIAELVVLNVALDVTRIGGLAYAMSHARRLTPHRKQELEEVEVQQKTGHPSTTPARRGKDPSGRRQGGQPGHEGKGRSLLPAWAVDEVVDHWPADCECGHVFTEGEVGELPPIMVS